MKGLLGKDGFFFLVTQNPAFLMGGMLRSLLGRLNAGLLGAWSKPELERRAMLTGGEWTSSKAGIHDWPEQLSSLLAVASAWAMAQQLGMLPRQPAGAPASHPLLPG